MKDWRGLLIGLSFLLAIWHSEADAQTTDSVDKSGASVSLLFMEWDGDIAEGAISNRPYEMLLIDGVSLNYRYENRQDLIFNNSKEAEFVSAVWSDPDGTPLHQRNVFKVKGDFFVVVDYVFGKGEHVALRGYQGLGETTVNKFGAEFYGRGLIREKAIRLRVIEPADISSPSDVPEYEVKNITIKSRVTLPAATATVVASSEGKVAPKIETLETEDPLVVSFQVTFPDGRIEKVMVAPKAQSLSLDGKTSVAWALCLRQTAKGSDMIAIDGKNE